MTTATLTGVVYDLPDDVYHARPELSSTGARRILDSPARFRWEQEHRVGKRSFDIGHAVHAKVLGVGAPIIGYPDEHLTPSGNPSTRAATRAWEDEQRAAGLTIVATADLARVDAMTEAVLAHAGARRILERPAVRAEVSAFATDPETGVPLRARFDLLSDDDAADLKTTTGTASRHGFGRDAARHNYPVQEAHYLDTLAAATGERPPFRWIVVEKHPPHLVAVHTFDDVTRIIGGELAATARRTYADCMASDEWPAYGDDVLTTAMPAWWLNAGDDDLDDIEFA